MQLVRPGPEHLAGYVAALEASGRRRRDESAFRIDIAGCYRSNREMYCLSLLATLLVPVMVSIVSAEEVSPAPSEFDVIIRSGTVYDGSGGEGRQADVALRGDRIAGVGNLKSGTAKVTIDARGLAVARFRCNIPRIRARAARRA